MNYRFKRDASQFIVTLLGNIAAIGAGLALYDGRWWCFAVAGCAVIWALKIMQGDSYGY